MKIGMIPERILERIGLALGLVPTPLADTSAMFILARTLIVATKLGIFESLGARPRGVIEVAALCDTNVAATNILLDALVSSGYLRLTNDCYQLAHTSRKWVLKESPVSLCDAILFADIEWNWMTHLDEFIRNGTPLDFHSTMTSDEWALYQRAMRSLAGIGAPEVARRLPVAQGAQDMLDIGGSHGYYSVTLCRRHPRLRATVLDLPQAITYAAPLLAKEGMSDRVVHWPGNALLEDFGVEAYDLILIAQLVHHFDRATNRELVKRASYALRPGGTLVILEALRPASRMAYSQLDGLLNLYFAFTSRSGIWSLEEISAWQQDAGLRTKKVIRFLKMPGIGAHVAVKPR